MTTPVHVFQHDCDSTNPDDDVVHIVCRYCCELPVRPRPLLSYCGTNVTDQTELPDYPGTTPEDCSMCIYEYQDRAVCPMCKRVDHR